MWDFLQAERPSVIEPTVSKHWSNITYTITYDCIYCHFPALPGSSCDHPLESLRTSLDHISDDIPQSACLTSSQSRPKHQTAATLARTSSLPEQTSTRQARVLRRSRGSNIHTLRRRKVRPLDDLPTTTPWFWSSSCCNCIISYIIFV